MTTVLRLLPLAALVALAGCQLDDAAPATGVADRPAAPAAASDARADTARARAEPQVVRDTLVADTARTPITALRVREDGGALPFETRVPEGVGAQTFAVSRGDIARFTLGQLPARSVFTVRLLPAPTTEAAARTAVDRLAAREADAADIGAEAPWALAAYRVRGEGGRTGRLWLARHAGRLLVLQTFVAPGSAPAVAPRVDFILDRWRWTATGARLTAPGARPGAAPDSSAGPAPGA